MQITAQMIASFNEMMQDNDSIIRLEKDSGNDYSYKIRFILDEFVEEFSLIYPTKAFYEILNSYFQSYGIKLTYNNTKQSFWVD